MRRLSLALALFLGGCATIIEGTTQEIAMDVVPQTAECSATQEGRPVARYNPTGRNIFVPKSRRDLIITCSAPGYQTKEVRAVSELSGWGIASILVWDLGLTDYATGALNKYDGALTIVLELDERTRIAPGQQNAAPALSAAPPRASYGGAFPPITSGGTR